jgi:hypothetical protein
MDVLEEEVTLLQVLSNEETTTPERLRAHQRLTAILYDRLEHRIQRSVEYFERADEWREKYIAMRRERDEAMDQWANSMAHQWAVEAHLEAHEDTVRMEIRTSAANERDRVGRELLERLEFWLLKKGVEAQDLDLSE